MWRRERGGKRFAALIKTKRHNSLFEVQLRKQPKALKLCVCCCALGLGVGLGVTIIRCVEKCAGLDLFNDETAPEANIFSHKIQTAIIPSGCTESSASEIDCWPRTWHRKPNDHLALCALWWLAQKSRWGSSRLTLYFIYNSSLVKQLTLLQIRNPSVWFSLHVWALTNSQRGNESHVAEGPKDIRWLSLWPVMEMSNNATQWRQKNGLFSEIILFFPLY